jgi:hypothetical protein
MRCVCEEKRLNKPAIAIMMHNNLVLDSKTLISIFGQLELELQSNGLLLLLFYDEAFGCLVCGCPVILEVKFGLLVKVLN